MVNNITWALCTYNVTLNETLCESDWTEPPTWTWWRVLLNIIVWGWIAATWFLCRRTCCRASWRNKWKTQYNQRGLVLSTYHDRVLQEREAVPLAPMATTVHGRTLPPPAQQPMDAPEPPPPYSQLAYNPSWNPRQPAYNPDVYPTPNTSTFVEPVEPLEPPPPYSAKEV